MVRQAFEQLWVALGDTGGDLPEETGTVRVPEVGQRQIDLYAISGVPHPIGHLSTVGMVTDIQQSAAERTFLHTLPKAWKLSENRPADPELRHHPPMSQGQTHG
ncbi:hypothetical protein SCYAM73S_02826 [Streptomyces cyaneofuscatus]